MEVRDGPVTSSREDGGATEQHAPSDQIDGERSQEEQLRMHAMPKTACFFVRGATNGKRPFSGRDLAREEVLSRHASEIGYAFVLIVALHTIPCARCIYCAASVQCRSRPDRGYDVDADNRSDAPAIPTRCCHPGSGGPPAQATHCHIACQSRRRSGRAHGGQRQMEQELVHAHH